MKAILTALFLSAATLIGADYTNGVFYVDDSITSGLMKMDGSVTEIPLTAGHTYMANNVIELNTATNQTLNVYFSGGPLVRVGPGSKFAILLFDQEVNNLDSTPAKADFGNHTLNLELREGELAVIYPFVNEYSMCSVSTPFADYQFNGGKYLVRASDKSAVVYIVEGMLTMHGDEGKVESVKNGNLAIAVPFGDPTIGFDGKIVSSIRKLDDADMFIVPVKRTEKSWGNVEFIVVAKKVLGVRLK